MQREIRGPLQIALCFQMMEADPHLHLFHTQFFLKDLGVQIKHGAGVLSQVSAEPVDSFFVRRAVVDEILLGAKIPFMIEQDTIGGLPISSGAPCLLKIAF